MINSTGSTSKITAPATPRPEPSRAEPVNVNASTNRDRLEGITGPGNAVREKQPSKLSVLPQQAQHGRDPFHRAAFPVDREALLMVRTRILATVEP